MARTQLANARWSTSYKNSLPDSAFFYVDQSCVHSRDRQGRSHPLNCRHFPYKDRAGRVDLKHVRNAIGRAPQSKLPLKVVREVQAEARRILARHGGYEREPEIQETYAMAANSSIRVPNIPRWKQISGDMDPGKYGAIIARSDGNALELVEIQPVREFVGDGEAAEVGFPFWSKEAWYDERDLQLGSRDVQHALDSMGIDLDEIEPEHRALAIAEALMRYGTGVDEGNSGWSKDVVPGEVEWWSGVGGPEFIADEDEEFRRDILGEEEEDDEFESNPRRRRQPRWPTTAPLRGPVEAVPSKQWRRLRDGATASIYGAVPWSGAPGDRESDWTMETVGWTVRNADGTVGMGRQPFKTKAEAEAAIRSYRERMAAYSRNPGRSSQHLGAEPFMGKFDSGLDEMVYGISLDGGGDEEVGDVDALGFALIMRNGPAIANAIAQQPPEFARRHMTERERLFLNEEGRAGVIIFVNSQGFVQVVYYDNPTELEEDWEKAVEELGVLAENPTRGARGEQAARAKFDNLRKRYFAAREKFDDFERTLGGRYGHQRGWQNWLKTTEKRRLDQLRAAKDRERTKFLDHLERISPRDWSYGVPSHWLVESLPYEDAVRPANESLSVVPPLSYGATEPRR